MHLKEQRSHKVLHLKVEALAVANVKLLSVKDYGLFAFISVCFNFDLVLNTCGYATLKKAKLPY